MMNYFSALHKYDLEIRFHRRELNQTLAFCGHVFTMKLLLKKINTRTHDRKQMWLPDAHLCYFILSAARPCVAVLLHGAATSSAISPQMHQQNPADAPPESRGTTRIRRTPTESCLHLQRDGGDSEWRDQCWWWSGNRNGSVVDRECHWKGSGGPGRDEGGKGEEGGGGIG